MKVTYYYATNMTLTNREHGDFRLDLGWTDLKKATQKCYRLFRKYNWQEISISDSETGELLAICRKS